VILFDSDTDNGLVRVAESGGAVTLVTTPDASRAEVYHDYPEFLPDGKHFLYFASSAKPENSAIFAGSLDSKERKLILNANSNLAYVSPGYLLFLRQGTLMAQPFDADRLQLSGEAVPVADDVLYNQFGIGAYFAASDNGVLAYRGGTETLPKTLAWVNRDGKEQPIPAPPHNYVFPRISPDGQRIAAGIEEREIQVELIGTKQQRRIILWEAAEGGIGVWERLIEEPEAHIHTHIQKTLFDRLNYPETQVIYSTHSTHISEVNNGAGQTGAASAQVLASAQSLSKDSNHLKFELDKFLSTVRAA